MIRRAVAKFHRALCAKRFLGSSALLLLLSACGLTRCTPDPLPRAQFEALYETPLNAPEKGLRVFHLGHSLVNRNMPDMLRQFAQATARAHEYESQIGWGTPLKSHWEPGEEVFGFEKENAHPRFRDVRSALESGDYDAVILTEMVELRDAIEYFESANYLHKFASLAREGRVDTRIYLYETWHNVNDPEGWRARLEKDRVRYWEDGILRPALAYDTQPRPIYVVPVGQVFAEIARQIEAGKLKGLGKVEDLFAQNEDGSLDTIHVGHLGNYIAALTHYAVLYHTNPMGLAGKVALYDESEVISVASPEAITQIQGIVWQVVKNDPLTGLARQ
ncbi:MAG: hypothetical protein WBC85_13325 [Planktotalea sp.]|uniref:hypothetical protein n=1 Tax=Planktotalea sp. TaxID=2029877 RepID=UPI003C71418F